MAKPKNPLAVFQTESRQMLSYVAKRLEDITHIAFQLEVVEDPYQLVLPYQLDDELRTAIWALAEALAHYRVKRTESERETGARR